MSPPAATFPVEGPIHEAYRADVADLRHVAESGHRLALRLSALVEELDRQRRQAVARFGPASPAGGGRSCHDLVDQVTRANRFVVSLEGSLSGFSAVDALVPRQPSWPTAGGRHLFRRLVDGVVDLVPTVEDLQTATNRLEDSIGAATDLIRRKVELLVDPIDDLVVESLAGAGPAVELVGWSLLGPGYPTVARFTNTTLTPLEIMVLWGSIDRFVADRPGTGDVGGTFTTRPTGARLPGRVRSPVDRGRRAVVSALHDTADGRRIHDDEFELIEHDENTYTLVLAGVVDLSRPGAGFDPDHYSARDTDAVAARSAASASIDDNLYARMVSDSLDRLGVPDGAQILIVGHSQGADTALDLASDPTFNGERFAVTHVVAAAYHSGPQLAHVQPDTEVLVVQNNKDIPVLVEGIGHLAPDPRDGLRPPGDRVTFRTFDGGWRGAGHHQDNYTDFLTGTDDVELERFFASVAASGYGQPGQAEAVDISVR